MNGWKTICICAVAVLSTSIVYAQEREQARSEMDRENRSVEREAVDIEHEMREAESRMAEAARRIAELSTRQLPYLSSGYWRTRFRDNPVLGITIGAPEGRDPVEGVEVIGVSPGGAAAEAGLRAGDVITAVNGEALGAESSSAANEKLLDFMSGVETGDVIDVEYLRAGRSENVEISPQPMSPWAFGSFDPDTDFSISLPSVAPDAPRAAGSRFVFVGGAQAWGDMEMVKLTEGLGRYFGTDEGLLVVRAPKEEAFGLEDGDVILNIDGRTPNSVSHAIRILGSYQEGENLEIRIMRDQRAQTLDIEMPQAATRSGRRGAVIGAVAPDVDLRTRVAPVVQREARPPVANER